MTVYFSDDSVTLHHGDALDVLCTLPDGSVDCCVTSPPYYGLRDYGSEGQYGLEASPAEYVETMRAVFTEVRRVLAADGTLWLNLGDSFVSTGGSGGRMASNLGTQVLDRPEARDPAKLGRWNKDWGGLANKNLLGIPWRVAFALQDDGWILRNDIIWAKPNAMPESVTDRLSTKHEHVFLFAKSARYAFNLDAIRESHTTADRFAHRAPNLAPRKWLPANDGAVANNNRSGGDGVGFSEAGKNPGDVWSIPTAPFAAAHFAVMPQALAARCISAGCKDGGTVLDTFSGSGTTGLAAARLGRRYVGIDLSSDYLDLSIKTRLAQPGLFADEDEATA